MENQRKNRKEKFERYLMIVTSCIALAGLLAVTATPNVTLAHHKEGHGGGGGGGDVGGDVSGWIFCRVTFDDGIGNAIESDLKGDYIDGVDRTGIAIGRNRNIHMDFNTHKKKDSFRTLHFLGGFPVLVWPTDECLPVLDDNDDLTPPINVPPPTETIKLAAKDAELRIKGEDHDDTPVGCCRAVNAVLTVKDDNDETWIIHFGSKVTGSVYFAPCGSDVIVQRLDNVDSDGNVTPDNSGFSQWTFATAGLGYVYRDNNPPHRPSEFWGTVSLPFSGTIESLTEEPEPQLDPGQNCADVYPNESVNCQ